MWDGIVLDDAQAMEPLFRLRVPKFARTLVPLEGHGWVWPNTKNAQSRELVRVIREG